MIPDSASAAAEILAGYESRFAGIELRLTVLQLMIGGLYAVGLPPAWLVVKIAAKVGVFGA